MTRSIQRGNRTQRIDRELDPFGLLPHTASALAVAREQSPETRRSHVIVRLAAAWRLTKREIDVLDLVARGMTNATMASMLGISEATIEFHLSRLFDKAGAETRSALLSRLLGA